MEITVENIVKRYGDNTVLDNVSLKCTSGKIYGIVGYNGAGKTVLLKSICGLIGVDEGRILINDVELGNELLKDVGVIIEEPAFVKNYSARKNLELLYMINHKRNKAVIENILTKVGLEYNSNKKVKHFSLGMKQRLAIAQALMDEPSLLILDEPMNGLDKKGVAEIRNVLLEQKKIGRTILLASHNQQDIDILCDEVYEVENGMINRIR